MQKDGGEERLEEYPTSVPHMKSQFTNAIALTLAYNGLSHSEDVGLFVALRQL